MAGAGYNIPISASNAETFAVPTSYNTPFYVNYGSGVSFRDSGGNAEANPILPATATSTAAEGNAASQVSGSGVGTSGGNESGMQQPLSTKTALIIVGGLSVVILVAAIIARR